MSEKINVPMIMRNALIEPSTLNEEERTVEITWTTGSQVRRRGIFGDVWLEELSTDPADIRMGRMDDGRAPFLKDHASESVDNVLGVILPASSVFSDGEGRSQVKFSSREEFQGIMRDIQDGILRNVSVGYNVHEMRLVGEQEGVEVFRAVDWEPMEVSLVAIGADPGAGVRNETCKNSMCKIIRGDNMSEETVVVEETRQEESAVAENATTEETTTEEAATETPETPVVEEARTEQVDIESLKSEATATERKRICDIQRAGEALKIDSKLVNELIEKGSTVESARELFIEKASEKETKMSNTNIEVGQDNKREGMREGFVNAIRHRVDGSRELSEAGRQYRNLSLYDMARECAAAAGKNVANMSRPEVVRAGLHTTSDFPSILEDTLGKELRDSYEQSPQTWRPFTRIRQVSDFKQISSVQLGDSPRLEERLESGEYKRGTMSEGAEKYNISPFGKMIAVSREMIINDDVGAFAEVPSKMGRAAADLESDLLWALITSNHVMDSGNALFSAPHSNQAGSGAAPSVTTLGAGRAAMRLQTGLDGEKLNIRPRYLVVPAALETVAEQLVSSIQPDQASNVNPFGPQGGTPLQLIVEPRLDDDSVTQWYLFAEQAAVPMLELAQLAGAPGPQLSQMEKWDTEGVEFKISYDIGVNVIDYRGFYVNAGA